MKNIFTLLSLSISLSSFAQLNCGSGRYYNEIFSVDTTKNVVYGWNTNISSTTDTLKMDIYQPAGDTLSARPILILAHGGSFIGGTKNDQDVSTLCHKFAARGYVTVSLGYRLGIGFPIDQPHASNAVYRAVQDMKAAVRFFRKDFATSNIYKIDTGFIVTGGSSAGAFMGLHLAYLTPNEIPSYIDTVALGGFEGTSGNPGYRSDCDAVINLCGALGDSSWITAGEVPLCSMHGTVDGTVPYGHAMLSIGIFPIMIVDGSYSLHFRAQHVPIQEWFHSFAGADHVPYAGTSASAIAYMDTTVNFVRDFLCSYMAGTLSINNPSIDKNDVKIFPNPAGHSFYIEFSRNEIASFKIYSITGKLMMQESSVHNNDQINLTGFAQGMYVYQLIREDGTMSSGTLVKE